MSQHIKLREGLQQSQHNKEQINNFYNQFGIKQYSCFSGGFKYIDKTKAAPAEKPKQQQQRDLYNEFGLSKTQYESYKLDKEYVPDTKFELADKLVEKLEHKMKKMNYYRGKYFGNPNQK